MLLQRQTLPQLQQQVEQLGGNGRFAAWCCGRFESCSWAWTELPGSRWLAPQVVFHLGAQFAWGLTIEQARAVNVAGALQVAELAAGQGSRLLMGGRCYAGNRPSTPCRRRSGAAAAYRLASRVSPGGWL